MQNFFHTKEAKRGYWTILNTLMALGVSFVAYMASENVAVESPRMATNNNHLTSCRLAGSVPNV
jgi:hypothetical protein